MFRATGLIHSGDLRFMYLRTIMLLACCFAFIAPVYAQSLQGAEAECVVNLHADIEAWSKLQEERRSLSPYKDDPDYVAIDMKYMLEGLLDTIDTSQLHNCPSKLSRMTRDVLAYAGEMKETVTKALDISERMKAGRTIAQSEIEEVDRGMQQGTIWQKTMMEFDAELMLQYSLVEQER